MKKAVAVLMALCLFLPAFAEEILWEDVEEKLAASGPDGEFAFLPEAGAMIWVPETMTARELTEGEIGNSYIAAFTDEVTGAALDIRYAGFLFPDYVRSVRDRGMEPELVTVNGLEAMIVCPEGTDAGYAVYGADEGYVLIVVLSPLSAAGALDAWTGIKGSVRAWTEEE